MRHLAAGESLGEYKSLQSPDAVSITETRRDGCIKSLQTRLPQINSFSRLDKTIICSFRNHPDKLCNSDLLLRL